MPNAVPVQPGEEYDGWIVMEYSPRSGGGNRVLCRCSGCGEERYKDTGHLKRGEAQSCKCARPIVITTGQVFGRLTALEDTRTANVKIVFRCECGNEKRIRAQEVVRGDTRSCRCLNAELTAARGTIHGLRKDPIYGIWRNMIRRCYVPKCNSYPNYGGRGIVVCDRWRGAPVGFMNFVADMGPRPSPAHTVERVNNDGPYAPWNCEWRKGADQAANRRWPVKNSVHNAALARIVELEAKVAELEAQLTSAEAVANATG